MAFSVAAFWALLLFASVPAMAAETSSSSEDWMRPGTRLADGWQAVRILRHPEFIRLFVEKRHRSLGLEIVPDAEKERNPRTAARTYRIQPLPGVSEPLPEALVRDVLARLARWEGLSRRPALTRTIPKDRPVAPGRPISDPGAGLRIIRQPAPVFVLLAVLWIFLGARRKPFPHSGTIREILFVGLLVAGAVLLGSTDTRYPLPPIRETFFLLPVALLPPVWLLIERLRGQDASSDTSPENRGIPALFVCMALLVVLRLSFWGNAAIFDDDAERDLLKALLILSGKDFVLRGPVINDGVFTAGPLYNLAVAAWSGIDRHPVFSFYLPLPFALFTLWVGGRYMQRGFGRWAGCGFAMSFTLLFLLSGQLLELRNMDRLSHNYLSHGFLILALGALTLPGRKRDAGLTAAALAFGIAVQFYALFFAYAPAFLFLAVSRIRKSSIRPRRWLRALNAFLLCQFFTLTFAIADRIWTQPFESWFRASHGNFPTEIERTLLDPSFPVVMGILLATTLVFVRAGRTSRERERGRALLLFAWTGGVAWVPLSTRIPDAFTLLFPVLPLCVGFLAARLAAFGPPADEKYGSHFREAVFLLIFVVFLPVLARFVPVNGWRAERLDLYDQQALVRSLKRHGIGTPEDFNRYVHTDRIDRDHAALSLLFELEPAPPGFARHRNGAVWITDERPPALPPERLLDRIEGRGKTLFVIATPSTIGEENVECLVDTKVFQPDFFCRLPHRFSAWPRIPRDLRLLTGRKEIPSKPFHALREAPNTGRLRFSFSFQPGSGRLLRIQARRSCFDSMDMDGRSLRPPPPDGHHRDELAWLDIPIPEEKREFHVELVSPACDPNGFDIFEIPESAPRSAGTVFTE